MAVIMSGTDLKRLDGQSVLVRSSRDLRNPPIAMRGTVVVHTVEGEARPVVKLVIDFPDLFNSPAHQRTMVLTDTEIARLTPAERGGLEFVTEQRFE